MNEVIISPTSSKKLLDFSEIWRYRELFYVFTWRDLKVRYKQTILGILWVIFQPLVNMVIFTVLFGNLAKIPSGNLPYSLFVLSGLVYWSYFQTALSESIESIIANQAIIKKIYFPKIIIVFASIINRLVDFSINFLILFIFSLALGYFPNVLGLIIFPFALMISTIFASGLGLILSALNVKYRDIRYIYPFMIQIMFYATPVVYPLAITSERNRLIMSLNPMSIVMESVRWTFSGTTVITPLQVAISIVISILLFIFGLWYFNKTEQFFADLV